ncbi:carbohydrate ABC transporter permease [Cryobacterium sp. Y11]|uniref:carbohydrate ABC transporter permease n=1 Tax=Cryobacterium sp. Y11 TaxID=2045016 RepID=UPI000CE541A0|nr:carbohydrate ABC transporter permease [Cryobacterium sp. Y11]
MIRNLRRDLLVYVFLICCAIFALGPFGWMLLTAFRTQIDLNSGSVFPAEFTVENFVQVWQTVPVLRYLSNSVIVTATILISQFFTAIPAGFALARMQNKRLSQAIVWIVLGATMVPLQVIAVPLFLALSKVGLVGTLAGLIVPFLASAFGVYMFRQFFLQFPEELIEAARLDGAGEVRILVRIVLPLARPTMIAFSVFSVTAHWNDFFWPFFTLRGDSAATIPFAIARFASNEMGTDFPLQMASATMAILPMVIAFLVLQRYFQSSILSGSQR